MNKELNQFDATLLKSLDEFMESYKMVDVDQVYSNGTEFVPIFRVKQWCEYNNINKLQQENQQLKKQKDDVVEYIKSNCIVSDEWTELDFCNFVPTGKVNYKALNKEKVKDLLRMLGEIDE